MMMIVITIAVISIGWYLTDKGEYTACWQDQQKRSHK